MSWYGEERRTDYLDLNIHLDQSLTERVDLDQSRVDSAVEATELCDETDITLRHRLVRVRTDNAAGNGAKSANAVSEGVNCCKLAIHLLSSLFNHLRPISLYIV